MERLLVSNEGAQLVLTEPAHVRDQQRAQQCSQRYGGLLCLAFVAIGIGHAQGWEKVGSWGFVMGSGTQAARG